MIRSSGEKVSNPRQFPYSILGNIELEIIFEINQKCRVKLNTFEKNSSKKEIGALGRECTYNIHFISDKVFVFLHSMV